VCDSEKLKNCPKLKYGDDDDVIAKYIVQPHIIIRKCEWPWVTSNVSEWMCR